jgi:hypothetical protein
VTVARGVFGAVVGVGLSGRVGVEEDVAEAGDAVDQPAAGVFEDVMGSGQVEGGVGVGVGVELAANPTDADPVHGLDASDERRG